MTDVFSDIVAGHGQHQRVLDRLQQVHQGAQQLVVLLAQTLCVLTPELGRLVHRGPLQAELNTRKEKNNGVIINNKK